MPPDQIAVANAHYARLLSGDTGIPTERKRQRKDGSDIYIEAANALVENVDGKKMVITTVRDITERKQASEKIADLLQEKELLLKETHHRIKNNMMVVSSLLSLQAAEGNIASDQQYKAVLNNAIRQVRSMMILYDKLYRSKKFKELNIRRFLPPLVEEIVATFHAVPSIRLEVQVDDFILSAKTLSTLGIIINEMISNSMKYAFEGCDNGVITISASKTDSLVTIAYEDNGIEFAEVASSQDLTGFGMRLIAILIQQLNGSIRIEGDNGKRFIIQFEA
jgi:two-component sensor histidine kinase